MNSDQGQITHSVCVQNNIYLENTKIDISAPHPAGQGQASKVAQEQPRHCYRKALGTH